MILYRCSAPPPLQEEKVLAIGRYFPILQREQELHDLVNHMGRLRAWHRNPGTHDTAK